MHGSHHGPEPGAVAPGEHPRHVRLSGGVGQGQRSVAEIKENRRSPHKTQKAHGTKAGKKLPQFLAGDKARAQKHTRIGKRQLPGRHLIHRELPLKMPKSQLL